MNIPRISNRRIYWLCASLFLCCVIQAAPSPLISQLGLPDGAKLRIGRGSVHSVDYSPDGRRIAAASTIGIWIYDARFGGEIALIGPYERWVRSAAYSPDGKRIVSAGASKAVRIWDADTGALLNTLKGHQRLIKSAAYSPDSKRIVSAGNDSTVRIWDADTGAPLKMLKGHTEKVSYAAYSPDGKRIVSGGRRQDAPHLGRRDGRAAQDAQRAYREGRLGSVFAGRNDHRQRKLGQDNSDMGRADRGTDANAIESPQH